MGDIKTRFRIDGEQQYRQAMTNAANAVKVLNSEQKLAKAQFQNTGNAEKYAADQARILKEKLAEQQKAVKAAETALKQLNENGVDKSSRQFQNWQKKLNDARTQLVQMQTELDNVTGSMDDATKAATDTATAVDSIGKKVSYDAVINGIGKITSAMETAMKTATQLAGEMWSTMQEAAGWADDLVTQATVYGVSTDQLQRMRYTADIIDTSADTIVKARQKLINNMAYGSDEIQGIFAELGIQTHETYAGKYGAVTGAMRDWEDVFWEAGNAIMRLTDYEEQNAKATKIFGKNWDQLLPMFNNDWASENNYLGRAFESARDYYDAVMASWDTTSEENVGKLGSLDDQMQRLENDFETLSHTVLAELAPGFEGLASMASGLLEEFNAYLQTDEGKAKMQDLSEAVTNLFTGLTDVDFGKALDTAKGILDSVTGGLKWIADHWGDVKTGLEGIAIAFGVLKVSEGVLTFMQLLASGKYLFGGSGGGGDTGGATGTESPTVIPTGSTQVGGGKTGLLSNLVNSMAVKTVLDDAFTIMETSKKAFEGLTQQEAQLKILMHDFGMTEQQAIEFDKLLGNEYEVEVEPVPVENAAEILEKEIGPISVLVVPQLSQPGMFPGGAGGSGVFSYALGVSEDYHPHANGLFSVPWDGYPAILHKGERVMTAREVAASRNYTYNSHNYFGNVNLNNGQDIEALCDSIDRHNRRQQTGYGS